MFSVKTVFSYVKCGQVLNKIKIISAGCRIVITDYIGTR